MSLPLFHSFSDQHVSQPATNTPKSMKPSFRINYVITGLILWVLMVMLVGCHSLEETQNSQIAVEFSYNGGAIADFEKSSIAYFSEESVEIIDFSPDGKYLYFYQPQQGGNLCRTECNNLKKASSDNQKQVTIVAENASDVKLLESGKILYGKRKNNTIDLYAFNGEISVLLKEDINRYISDGSDYILVSRESSDIYSFYSYWLYDLTDLNDVKIVTLGTGYYIPDASLSEQSDYLYTYPDGSSWGITRFYFCAPDDAGSSTETSLSRLYYFDWENGLQLLCQDMNIWYAAHVQSYSGRYFFLKENSTKITLYDYLHGATGNESKEYLQHFQYPVYSLYSCSGKDVSLVQDDILHFESTADAILFNTIETASEKIEIGEIQSISEWDFDTIFNVGHSRARFYALVYYSGELLRMSESAAEVYAKVFANSNPELYFSDTYAYLLTARPNSESRDLQPLFAAEIDNGTIGTFNTLCDNITWLSLVDGGICYGVAVNQYSENYGELYMYKDGNINKLGDSIPFDRLDIFEDGSIFAQGGIENKLVAIDKSGNIQQIDQDIISFVRADKSLLLYLKESPNCTQDLYTFDGKETCLYLKNVNEIRCHNTFPATKTILLD